MRRVRFDMPAASAGSKRLESPGRRAAKLERAARHRSLNLAKAANENAETLNGARDARRESWQDRTRNRQDETILTSEQERRELQAAVRREVVARNGDVADAERAARTLHIAPVADEGAEFHGPMSLRGTR